MRRQAGGNFCAVDILARVSFVALPSAYKLKTHSIANRSDLKFGFVAKNNIGHKMYCGVLVFIPIEIIKTNAPGTARQKLLL